LWGRGILAINDVAGVKVVLEASEQWKLIELLGRFPDCEIVEEERHDGRYNATNLIIRSGRPGGDPGPASWSGYPERHAGAGFSPGETNQSFAEFVRQGRGCSVRDHLLQLPGDAGERDRPLHPRGPDHRTEAPSAVPGPLARTSILLEYLFSFPSSHQRELGELPIKIWNRYLPDYFDEILKQLFHIPPDNFLE